jgi:mannose-1-phosphate guanylyltransferase
MLHAVIMAGGSGTRFWPLSRRHRPKQLLALAAQRPILRLTFDRVVDLVPPERIWVVTTAGTAEASGELLPELPPSNILIEPEGRDTAACAGYAAINLLHNDPEAVCAMLPADHVIGDEERFRSAVAAAAEHVASEGGVLTFGVRPTRPETGYGYLELGESDRQIDDWQVHRLQRFVEKPDPATAQSYLEAGGYLWNSGMFLWRVSDYLGELRRQLPELASKLERLAESLGSPDAAAAITEIYPTLTKTSVDFGVMEGAERCWTIPVDFPWSDIGAWPALVELLPSDDHGNAALGRCVSLGSGGNLLISDGPLVAVAGVRDLVVVATKDAVLVVPSAEAQQVKALVTELEARGWDDVL